MSDYTPQPPPEHRPYTVIEADIARETETMKALLNTCHLQARKRQAAIDRRHKLEAKHRSDSPGDTFDPEMYTPPAYIPSEDTPESRELHRTVVRISVLKAELLACKRAMFGQ